MQGLRDKAATPDEVALLREEAERVLGACVGELCEAGKLSPGGVIVLGCSTSEVAGGRIGKYSVPDFGAAIAEGMIAACKAHGMRPAFQCCEHLNRAIVMEEDLLKELGLTRVHAVPKPKAGGSVPAAAWKILGHPALAMAIQADAAIDVGDTLVGMQIRPVAVPLRPSCPTLGHARVVMAYSRWPLIGGERAEYR
ncbi:MAG: TIGR01440 family protein [Clostridia bacterium]|nr:TIGR01440 family protein [Clostridia bacterium]